MKFDILGILNKGKFRVSITGVNIKLQGHMHGMPGMQVRDTVFDLEIPFMNKTHKDMLTEAASFKAETAKPFMVKGIEIAEPFRLVSMEPKLPMVVKADERVVFKLKVQAPEMNYSGAMTVNFLSDSVELVHIEISKTTILANGKKTEIETSSRILNIPKGQIFSEKVQLYKALSFGDSISSISVSGPFRFVSSDPKLPIKMDDPNSSYIVEILIQAPAAPYAGILEIRFN